MPHIHKVAQAVASVERDCMSEETAILMTRYAREAGHISQGARGRNAPSATHRDCANLLMALHGSGGVAKNAPAAVSGFGKLLLHHGSSGGHPQLKFLEQRNTAFGDVLEQIVSGFVNGDFEKFMREQTKDVLAFSAPMLLATDNAAMLENSIDGFLAGGQVRFEISFSRPFVGAEVRIDRQVPGGREYLAGATFIQHVDDMFEAMKNAGTNPAAGRRDVTTMGFDVLMAVARAMRAAVYESVCQEQVA